MKGPTKERVKVATIAQAREGICGRLGSQALPLFLQLVVLILGHEAEHLKRLVRARKDLSCAHTGFGKVEQGAQRAGLVADSHEEAVRVFCWEAEPALARGPVRGQPFTQRAGGEDIGRESTNGDTANEFGVRRRCVGGRPVVAKRRDQLGR